MRTWWVLYRIGADGQAQRCVAFLSRYEAEESAAYLNRFGDGKFLVRQE